MGGQTWPAQGRKCGALLELLLGAVLLWCMAWMQIKWTVTGCSTCYVVMAMYCGWVRHLGLRGLKYHNYTTTWSVYDKDHMISFTSFSLLYKYYKRKTVYNQHVSKFEPMFILDMIETTSLHMLSVILNVFILIYLTTHVACHLECVYSKLPHYTCCLPSWMFLF